jgi:hypothetical protein
LTASIIAELAGNVLRLDERLKSLDDQIEELFQQYRNHQIPCDPSWCG